MAQHSFLCSHLWFVFASRSLPRAIASACFVLVMSASGLQFLGGAEAPPSNTSTAREELSQLRRSLSRRAGRWGRSKQAVASDLHAAAAVPLPGDEDDLDGAESIAPTESVAGTDLISEVGHEMEAECFERLEEVREEGDEVEENVEENVEEQVDEVTAEEQPSHVQEFADRTVKL